MPCQAIWDGRYCPNKAEEHATYCTDCRARYGQSYWVKRPSWFQPIGWENILRSFQ